MRSTSNSCRGQPVIDLRGATDDDGETANATASSAAPALLKRPQFRAYLAANAAFMLPGGIMGVLFPWLVAVQLAASAQQLGLAQMASQIPMLLLVIFGGILADRRDPRRILLGIHLLASVPPLALALVILGGQLNYAVLIAFALASGTLAAFSMPARDSLLTTVGGDQVQRAVGFSMGLQFLVQVTGFGLASLADSTGPVPLLLLMSALMASGFFAALALPHRLTPVVTEALRPSDVLAGVTLTLRSALLLPPMILAFGTGVFYAGSFMVLLPLIVRDVYGGSAAGIGAAFIAVMLGTLISIVIIIRGPGIRRQGRAMLLSQGLGAVVLASLVLNPPKAGFLAILLLWGMCGGIGMLMSRTIVQQAAPESHRGRVLSVFSLANLGGMPLGSLLLGFAAGAIGPSAALFIPAVAMLSLSVSVGLTSALWRQKEA